MKSESEFNQWLNTLSQEFFIDEDIKSLRSSSEDLRSRYRDKTARGRDLEVRGKEEASAYLAWRFPATAMVIYEVLGRLKEAYPAFEPNSVLDLGAGPAASVLPAAERFPGISAYTLVEEQPAMLEAGRALLARAKGDLPAGLTIHEVRSDLLKGTLPRADLVLASYVVNELSESETDLFCRRLQACAAKVSVLIVPGTPHHFRQLTAVRNRLLEEGHAILAPCTFTGRCHLEDQMDWCHFSRRVQRSRLLRQLKSAQLSYEDEKFSYLIMLSPSARSEDQDLSERSSARIIRHPQIQPGYREATLCRDEGITVSRFTKGKDKERYKDLKKKGWGDLLELPDHGKR